MAYTGPSPLPVSGGGTGGATFTAHGVILGEAAAGFGVTGVGATGELLIGASGADPAFGTTAYGNFTFSNLVAATPRTFAVTNTDTNAASTAEIRASVPAAGADCFISWEVQATGFYSAGVDNSVAGDPWVLSNSSTPSAGNALISTTNAGVITLFNDLDVTEGGTGVSTLTSHGILMGNGAGDINATAEPTNGQILIGKTTDFPQLATLTAGTGIGITNGAGTITINSVGGALTWTSVNAGGALAINNGYSVALNACSFSLPIGVGSSPVGSIISVLLDAGTSWAITQGAGQQIRFGNVQTTLGVGGSLASTANGDCVTMVCTVADTMWAVISSVGNITYV
jgi:hypothetical protein